MLQTPPTSVLTVVCLCADWCGTCKDYRAPFMQLENEFPDARFMWIDIEDESELVDPIEIDNFPTLLIAKDGKAQFFGTITPQMDTLRRLIHTYRSGDAPALADPEVQALVKKIGQK
jgi:thioredoxin 1